MDNFSIVQRYFAEYITAGVGKFLSLQRQIAADRIYSHQAYGADGRPRSRSGVLRAALDNPGLRITASGQGIKAVAEYPTYLRFLDMKRRSNYKVYNKPVWETMYSETLQDIKYEFRSWLKRNMSEGLTAAGNP